MKIVVAVSGGIDSVVLLHQLINQGTNELIVAHVDHGIRDDSREDAELVAWLAEKYNLPYAETQLHLGKGASEEIARDQRYSWLRQVKQDHAADYIATAHHQDDVIETMIINLIRGTGWRGLCALREHGDMLRPLIALSKAEIVRYAIDHELQWRDDSTNQDVRYLRNFVRYAYVQRMSEGARHTWLELYNNQLALSKQIDDGVATLLPAIHAREGYSRYQLIMMGRDVFAQIIQTVIESRLERTTVDQLWHFVCTARPEKKFVQGGVCFRVTTRDLIVSTSDIC